MNIAWHESIEIRYIKLFVEVRDILGPYINVAGESVQLDFGNEIDMLRGSFVTMLASGTSSAFHLVEPFTYASSYMPDEDIGDPNFFYDDVGDAPDFGVGGFVPTGGFITFYEPLAHKSSMDFDVMRAPQFPNIP
ncbi:hypothetical protein GQ457_18G007400 [Hibiscus cannabinus]